MDCVAFLQWALPRLGRRWAGYRKVRRQVCRRVHRRAAELGLDSLNAYQEQLEHHPEEWAVLDGLTNVTISRFFRDRGVFEYLDSEVLRRAEAGRYPPSALREVPAALREQAFADGVLDPRIRRRVTFVRRDVRDDPPGGPFDLVLCRNLAFTYFDDAVQRAVLQRIASVVRLGGALVIGAHEDLPAGQAEFTPGARQHGVFRRRA